MRTGYPIRVWAFGLLHTRMGVPYEPIWRMGDPYAYGGRPIKKKTAFFLNTVDQMPLSFGCMHVTNIIFLHWMKINCTWYCNPHLDITVTLNSFPCSDNLKLGLALNVWHQPGVYQGIVTGTACGEYHCNFLAYTCSHYLLLKESSTLGTIYLRKLVQHQLTNWT